MAKIGVGSAKVDLVLDRREWRLGEMATGYLQVVPGKVDQQVDQIYVYLNVIYVDGDHRHDVRVQSVNYPGMLLRAGGEAMRLPFSMMIPAHLPITRPGVSFYFSSGLDIDQAIDPSDRDAITVYPSVPMETVLRALGSLGFVEKRFSAELERKGQELEFYAQGPLSSYVKELDVVFMHEPEGLRLYIEVERRVGGLGGLLMESLDLNEQRSQLWFPYAQLSAGTDEEIQAVAQAIYDHLRRFNGQLPVGAVTQVIPYGQAPMGYPQGMGHHSHKKHHHGGMGGAMTGFLGGMVAGSVIDDMMSDDGADDGGFDSGDDGGFDDGGDGGDWF